jgi:hypothetical protein
MFIQPEYCQSRMTGKSKVILRKYIFVEKYNEAAYKN